jgi:hypothetical protein
MACTHQDAVGYALGLHYMFIHYGLYVATHSLRSTGLIHALNNVSALALTTLCSTGLLPALSDVLAWQHFAPLG